MSVLPQAPTAVPSVLEHIRAQHRKKMAQQHVAVQLPGWDGVFVRFRSLDDWSEMRDVAQEISASAHTELQTEIQSSIATLRLSAVSAYARGEDGEIEELPPLGFALYDALVPEGDPDRPEIGPQTDDEAIVMLFRGTAPLVSLAGALMEEFGQVGIKVDEEIAKNS